MQYKRLLVGMDFGASSLAAVRWAARCFAPDAEIVLFHVLRDAEAPGWLRSSTSGLHALHDELTPSLRGGLRGLAELIDPDRVQVAIGAGVPADALVAAAETYDADLICLGQTRTRRGSARFGATTAQRVLARTDLPVAIVPGARSDALDHVLVAADEPLAPMLLSEAWRIAQRSEARLHPVHVLSPEVTSCLRSLHPAPDHHEQPGAGDHAPHDESERAIRLTHHWLETVLDASGVSPARVTTHVRIGDPGQEVIAVANATSADLIVMGRDSGHHTLKGQRRRTAETRVAVGSTTRFITWAAQCPTLVLPGALVDATPGPVDDPASNRHEDPGGTDTRTPVQLTVT